MAEILKLIISYFQLFYFKFQSLVVNLKLKTQRANPEYSRLDWIFKAITLYLCYVGMDLSGLKLNELDVQYYFGKISYETAYGLPSMYYWAVHGLCMGLALWKMFEMLWWGQAKVREYNAVKIS